MGIANAKADLKTYQEGYPNARGIDNPRKRKNLLFYKGEIRSKSSGSPSGGTIEEFHTPYQKGGWWGDYDLLESHHGYIQWLFPIHEQGLNYRAQVLQRHEAYSIREDPKCVSRVIRSYELMLDFYGMQLDRATGKVSRSKSFRKRYDNLNACFHNYLRITRILKCLGEMGLERYKLPFLVHVGTEILVHSELENAKDSLLRYWAPTLRDQKEREDFQKRIDGAVEAARLEEERKWKAHLRDLEESKKRVASDPHCVVTKRVSVKWRVKQHRYPYRYVSKYYEGKVMSYDADKKTHFVLFDDGDKKHYVLSTQDFKILPDPETAVASTKVSDDAASGATAATVSGGEETTTSSGDAATTEPSAPTRVDAGET